jgi:uncharacterized membrane protein
VSFESALNLAFHEIRQNSRDNISVILAQLESLERLEPALPERNAKLLLWRQAEWIAESASRAVESPHDREVIEERVRRLSAALRKEAES